MTIDTLIESAVTLRELERALVILDNQIVTIPDKNISFKFEVGTIGSLMHFLHDLEKYHG